MFDTGSAGTSFSASSVADGTYYVRVRALIGASTGDPSNEVVVVIIGTGDCTGPPPAPLGLTATVSGRFVSLSWTASGTITGIVLEVGSAPGASDVALFLMDRSARAAADTAPPGVYFARVRATNSCGSSGASNELAIRAMS